MEGIEEDVEEEREPCEEESLPGLEAVDEVTLSTHGETGLATDASETVQDGTDAVSGQDRDSTYATDGGDAAHEGVLEGEEAPRVASLESDPVASIDQKYYGWEEGARDVAVEVGQVAAEEHNIDEEDSDEIDFGMNDVVTTTSKKVAVQDDNGDDIHISLDAYSMQPDAAVASVAESTERPDLESLPPRFYRDGELGGAVEEISGDKSFKGAMFAFTHRIQKRVSTLLASRYWKKAMPIILASLGVALSMHVISKSDDEKSLDGGEQTHEFQSTDDASQDNPHTMLPGVEDC
ncbi:hypothetical protein ACHAW5_006042 [Stephanodiscus triporus]|uniref:Uncharacterized protein n=1 Tax=Stephanodiscus triporus TaxID=2934178 RepID=A0ABD3QA06_9STRA